MRCTGGPSTANVVQPGEEGRLEEKDDAIDNLNDIEGSSQKQAS